MRRPGPRSVPLARIISLVAVALVLAGLLYLRSGEESSPVGVGSGSRTSGADRPSPAREEATRAPAPAPAPADAADASVDDRYDLDTDEARGGHTLARHVERTDAQLRQRLAEERGISTASTYTTRALAERTIARTLRANADRVQAWTARRGNRTNLALDYQGPRQEVLGRSIRRGRAPVDCSDAVVVLRWDGRGSYVLTSYPEPSR
jgi:hypothetical protein